MLLCIQIKLEITLTFWFWDKIQKTTKCYEKFCNIQALSVGFRPVKQNFFSVKIQLLLFCIQIKLEITLTFGFLRQKTKNYQMFWKILQFLALSVWLRPVKKFFVRWKVNFCYYAFKLNSRLVLLLDFLRQTEKTT